MPFTIKKITMRLRNDSEYIPLPGVRGEAGPGVPAGGTTGQVLAKASNADNDTEWVNQSGGGGTSDYDDLTNKPSINNVTLSGNKTASELGLATPSDIPTVPVQSVNGKTGAVVLDATDVGAYSKPSGGIPQTDLASAVQSKLDNTVVVSDTQPTATENKLWVDTDAGAGSTYQVPTVAEMEAADAQVAAEIGSQIADSGWKNLTLTSAFAVYATSLVAQYRKIGNLVMLRGQIKPTSEIAASTTNTIMSTLPTGFRPGLALTFVCQGSGVERWALTTYANGDLGVARYGAAALAAIPANAWLSFNVMFFVG